MKGIEHLTATEDHLILTAATDQNRDFHNSRYDNYQNNNNCNTNPNNNYNNKNRYNICNNFNNNHDKST